ncbi:interferon lambda-2-like [Cetorhinus maximus]
MATTPPNVAFLIIASCLAPSLGSDRTTVLPERDGCQLSRYAPLPHSELQLFEKLHRHLGSSLVSGHRRVLVSSEQLRRLEVPERLLLVKAEFNLFIQAMQKLEALENPRATELTEDVLQALYQMWRNISKCIAETMKDQTNYSKQLNKFLWNLERTVKLVDANSAKGIIVSDLFLLLNEHVRCLVRGRTC